MTQDADRFKAVLAALVKEATRHLPLALGYPATVLKDWGDGHVDVQPVAADLLPPMTRIPLRVGFPGLAWKIKEGAAVLIGFERGEADGPYAFAVDGATLELASITTGAGATLSLDDGRGATSEDGAGAVGTTTITLRHPAGQRVVMLPNGDLLLDAAPGRQTLINGGEAAAARLGDQVTVDGKIGTITKASSTVFIG